MNSPLLQLEIALHDADCPGHDENFGGHGDKYEKLAKAAMSVMPSEISDPWYLRDLRQMVELIGNKVCEIEQELKR